MKNKTKLIVGDRIVFYKNNNFKFLTKGTIAHIDNMFTICDMDGNIYNINKKNIKYVNRCKKLILSVDNESIAINYDLIDKGHGILEFALRRFNEKLKSKNKKFDLSKLESSIVDEFWEKL